MYTTKSNYQYHKADKQFEILTIKNSYGSATVL